MRTRRSKPSHPKPMPMKKRKQWSEEQMVAAMEMAKQPGVSVLRAAIEHNVPRSTLQDRVSGKVVHRTKPGPRPYLSQGEEDNLCEFLQAVSQAV